MVSVWAVATMASRLHLRRVRRALAWRGYAASFPDYVIAPHRFSERVDVVAVVGHTTGSHLGLPDEDERAVTLIWLARVRDGLVAEWTLIEDTPDNRAQHGLTDPD